LDQPKKILVIEKDEVIVLLISHLLARQSYVVHATLDAREAVDLLGREQYDAILIEPKIPNGGIELFQAIADRHPELLSRVIVVTGAVHDLPNLSRFPFHGIIRKPVEITSLIETVRDCVTPPERE
jgi:DNA-binding NtrC family response regulator